MADTFTELLTTLGFDAADTAQQVGVIDRQLDVSKAGLSLSGEQERANIDDSFESRGMYRSGARAGALTRQRASETQRADTLDAAAAGDVAALDRYLTQQKAMDTAAGMEQDAAQDMTVEQMLWALGIARADTGFLTSQLGVPEASFPTRPIPAATRELADVVTSSGRPMGGPF